MPSTPASPKVECLRPLPASAPSQVFLLPLISSWLLGIAVKTADTLDLTFPNALNVSLWSEYLMRGSVARFSIWLREFPCVQFTRSFEDWNWSCILSKNFWAKILLKCLYSEGHSQIFQQESLWGLGRLTHASIHPFCKSCIPAVKSSVLSTGCGQKQQQSACLQECTVAGGRQIKFLKNTKCKVCLRVMSIPWPAIPLILMCLGGSTFPPLPDANTARPENLWGHLNESVLLQRAILVLSCTLTWSFQLFAFTTTPLPSSWMSTYFCYSLRGHTQWCTCKVCSWFEHPSAWPGPWFTPLLPLAVQLI